MLSGQLFADRNATDQQLVVALHGWGRDRRDFAECLAPFNYLSIDLPGFGLSPAPGEVWGTSEYADLVAKAIKATDLPAVVVGHSFGGRVAVLLAARHPELVSGLVLTGVPLIRTDIHRKNKPFGLAKALHRRKLLSSSALERVRSHYGSEDYKRAHGIMRDILVRVVNETYEDSLQAIRADVTLVWGRNDAAVPVWMAEKAAELLPRARLEIIDGIGHHVPITASAQLGICVSKMLERQDSQ